MPLPQSAELFYGLKLTDEQRIYLDSIFDNKITFVNAKAGTGKTTLAIGAAKIIAETSRFEINSMIYTFSPVEERKLGFTPGDVEEKESKYSDPLKDALKAVGESPKLAIYREDDPDFIREKAWVESKSHVFMRGTNHIRKFIVIDEAQNLTRGELKKVLTRIHDDCKVVVVGHDGQCDLPDPSKSGFVPYMNHYADKEYAGVCELTVNFRGEIATHADELEW